MKTVGRVSKIIEDLRAKEIFSIWQDVDNWNKFNKSIIYAKLENKFEVGNKIILKLLNGRKINLILSEVTFNKSFTDVTNFPFAKMYGVHEIIEIDNKIEIIVSIKIDGLFSFIWEKLVAKKVANKIEDDLNRLIELVRNERTK